MATMSSVSRDLTQRHLDCRLTLTPEKLLGQMKGADFDKLVEYIKPQLVALKKYAYGKQISAVSRPDNLLRRGIEADR